VGVQRRRRGGGRLGWWEARQENRLGERALVGFEQEIRQNWQSLRDVMPYHVHLRDQFVALSGTGEIRSFDDLRRVEGFRGVRPAFLTTTAWRTSLATGALTHIDYDLVAALSSLYTLQERFTETSRPDFLSSPGAWTEANVASTVQSVVLYFGDVTAQARELAEVYQVVLELLERQGTR
jgi:hypothetical protein